MKNRIDSKFMKKFIALASEQLEGEWVVMGGTVLPLLGIDLRVTVDIDVVGLELKNSNQQSLRLMALAESMGLPIEAVNQAGAYFLSKIPDVREHLVLYHESKKCKIYRPNVYLFLKLKIARLSQSDLEDCLAMIKHNNHEFKRDQKKILSLLKMAKLKSSEAQARLTALLEFVLE